MLAIDGALTSRVGVFVAEPAETFDALFGAHPVGVWSATRFDSRPQVMATPLALAHLDVVSSTQDEARSRFRSSPVLVTASSQTVGRGRRGTVWETADRAVAASLALLPRWPAVFWPLIPAVAGLSALDVLGSDAMLKWPNDVVVHGAKVAGILVESDPEAVVVGIGINLFWADPLPGAAGLVDEDPGPDAGPRVAEAWARRFLDRMDGDPEDWGRAEYEERSATVGLPVTWQPGGSGRAVGIASNGGLIVESDRGTVVLDSGVVAIVRTSREPPPAG